jgi:hypothetical protein
VGSIRTWNAATPRIAVTSAAATRMALRRRWTHAASPGRRSGERVGLPPEGSSAGTITSVRRPQITMLWPISVPSCCRLGKSTNARP